jgi:mitogen-activated protein kinase 1/3
MSTGWKHVDINEHVSFRVPEELQFVKKLGSGAFATAAAFKNATTGQAVAVKKIANAFEDVIDGKRHVREVQLLRQLKHENIISILDMFMPEDRSFEDIYIVQEHMDCDLHKVINSQSVLEEEHNRYFVYQILCAVHYIHSANLVHRDLKPANVLVNRNCDVKVCDFGLARAGCLPGVTDYVVTRWWRAPEVVLLPSAYNEKVDVWSIGCILAELMGRKPIFRGADHLDQIKKIFHVVGTPSEGDLDWLPPEPCPARRWLSTMPVWPKQQWSAIYPNASDLATAALEAMICMNPAQRLSAKDAMKLAFFQPLYVEGDIQDADAPIACTVDSIVEPTKYWIRNVMYAECCKFHPEHLQPRVIQLHPLAMAADGTLPISCHGLAGDELATIVAEPGQDISDLRAKLSRRLDEPMELLQLLRADGHLLNSSDAEEHLDARVVLAL